MISRRERSIAIACLAWASNSILSVLDSGYGALVCQKNPSTHLARSSVPARRTRKTEMTSTQGFKAKDKG
jgi:hypothetical protein